MWRLKQLIPKDQVGLEGKTVEVGAFKLQVRSTIAQGGFSSVYLARDGPTGRQYAVKHIICNDAESVDLVKREVTVMKALKGHPNVVTLHAQVMYDMGRTKECFLVMDYCDKMLANVLENRGAGFFEEKQLLLIFRDICNAVYAMHCQSPPIAHRDLKVENVLMGGDGCWKLCDFGSTSTNHKRFEKADEMGLEEDIIRKYTTPAYRSPEMWDLFQRELINEKVDVWALGCLLFRITYLKSAFDGESKLQILNGNYRIPEVPRYSNVITDLIRDMLSASPDKRPDVMQVWRRVDEALPADVRKHRPDKAAGSTTTVREQHPESRPQGQQPKGLSVPSRSPPLPPAAPRDAERRAAQNGASTGVGAFWSTPFAQDAVADSSVDSDKSGVDSPKPRLGSPRSRSRREEPGTPDRNSSSANFLKKKGPVTNLIKKVQGAGVWGREDHDYNGYEMRHDSEDLRQAEDDETKGFANVSPPVLKGKPAPSNDPAFNEFAAQFDTSPRPTDAAVSSEKHHDLQAELDRVNKELQKALAEKAVVSSKYEKLTAVCRSQQQEIQGLKTSLGLPRSPSTSSAKGQQSPSTATQGQFQQQSPKGWQAFDQGQPREKEKERQSGSIWDLQQGLSSSPSPSPSPSPSASASPSPGGSTTQRTTAQDNAWQPFPTSVRTFGPAPDGRRRSLQHTRAASMGGENWGFSRDAFSANSGASGPAPQSSSALGTRSSYGSSLASSKPAENQGTRGTMKSQPAGWAGF